MKPKLLDKVDKKLFTLDESMTNVMSLPPKPEKFSSGILPKKNNNKSKSGDNSKDYLMNVRKRNNEEEELGFLADIIGVNHLSKEFFSNSNRANNISNDNNNQSSKPLTQVLSQAVLEGASVTMEKLKTVEDAASYFARYGSETPIKFVRLVTVNDGLNFTPYDLITTDMYDPNIEHYTMSPAGMVYMSPNEQSDCVPLSLWMRQKFNFNILRKIPFFKHYLNRKAFTIWFENVKYQLFMKQRKKVIDKLFLARKTCCPAVLSTRNHLLSIKQVKLLNYDLKTCDKDVFIDQQFSQLSQASIQFEETMRRVTSEVQSVIIEVNNIYSLAYQDTSNNMLLFNDSSKPEKAKSLVKLKQEKADRKLMRQKAKLEFSTLCDYIRYMDYLCLEYFFDYTINSIKLFYDEFNKPRKQGLFETMVRFANNGTVFNPTSEDIHDMMVKLFENVISTVGNMNRVGYITVKGINLNPIISANISTIIKENIQYNQTIENIKARIVSDYERAEEHSTTYEQVRPIYDFNMSWNFDEYKSKQHDILSLKKMMELITGWSKELDKLRNKPIGILDVDSRKLKAELYPMREARLSEIKEYIKDIARVKCMQLLDHYKDCINKINPRPNVLKDFAKQVQTVNSIKDDEKNLFIQTSQVDQMYNLLQLYEVTIPNEDVVLHEELYNKQQEYKRDIENVFIFREQKLNEMINNVNVCITKLHEQILAFLDKLDDPNFTRTQLIDEPDWVLDDLSLLVEKFESLNVLAKLYSSYQKLFNVPVTEYAELEAGTKKVNITQKLWETVRDWGEDHTSWMEDEFTKLNVQKINKKVITYYNEAVSLHKELGNAISEKLKDRVSEFKDMMPSVLDLGNKNMKPRHFEKLFGLINQVYYPTMSYTLYQLIKGGIMKFKDVIHETSTYATGEALLEKTLSEIKDKWDKTKFIVKNHRDQHGLYILGSLDDIFNQIEEHQIILQNMLHSPYIKDISDRIYGWIQKLNSLTDTIDEWTVCQKLYIYIENIFINEDIQKQLPNESQKFLTIDRSWKTIMLKTYNDTLVTSCLNPMEPNTSNGGLNLLIIEQLRINNDLLQTIEKSLDDYLDTKRILFPRFSYLSNNELVEVLSLSKDSHMIQRYLTKCFDSIVKLKFGDNKKSYDVIFGFYDSCDEYIEFNEVIKADSQVEIWLIQLEKSMKNILYEKLKLSFHTYPSININLLKSLDSTTNDSKLSTNTPRIEWLLSYPSQVILSIDQVIYTNQCITYINKYIDIFNPNNQALKELFDITIYEIDLFIEIIKSSTLSTNQVMKMNTLLILYIHNRDNVKNLISNSINSLNDYVWIKSLRYYWEKSLYSEDLLIKQLDNSFDYGYEYIGCSSRLVITPLTDMCYLTLTTALSMQLGGSVSGPAGSGKTETIKDLSKTFANFCLVFNCSESVDYKVTNRLFSGLAQQGSWICFDEFNRLDRQVISVIAAQILSIQQAIRNKVNEFSFNGKTIPINHNFGVFITTNPDYAKRIDLPENLKALFRPVAMMIPDYRLIAEVLLYTFGYTNASILSQKLLTLFKLSSELLSKQLHYDFGMRSMKIILNIIGNNNKLSKNNDESIIINAIRDVILPRLVDPDTPVFTTIMNDIFPGNKLDSKSNDIRKSIDKILDKYKLQKPTNYTNKIMQIHDTLEIRNACIMIGETASGKSTALKVLGNVKSDIDDTLKVDKYVINPTAISIDELYGLFNRQTNEWRDGILSKLVRDCVDSFNEQKII